MVVVCLVIIAANSLTDLQKKYENYRDNKARIERENAYYNSQEYKDIQKMRDESNKRHDAYIKDLYKRIDNLK